MSELVTDYMERVTPVRMRLSMWWHLVRCDACRQYFDQVRRTVRLLGNGTPPASDGTVEQRVIAAARDRQDPNNT